MSAHDHCHHSGNAPPGGSFWSSRAFLVLLGFAAIAVVLLWEVHKGNILGAIPYLFILACPLLHAFMLGGLPVPAISSSCTDARRSRVPGDGHRAQHRTRQRSNESRRVAAAIR